MAYGLKGITGFIPWFDMHVLSLRLEYCGSATKTLPSAAFNALSKSLEACFFSFLFAGATIRANGSSETASMAR
jgi:hypothetical protein